MSLKVTFLFHEVNQGGTNEQLLRDHLSGATIELVAENGEQFDRIATGDADLTVSE